LGTMAKSPPQSRTTKQIVFLSGLPRTGSTLLTSILSQDPDIYVDGSSPLARILFGVHRTCNYFAHEGLVRTNRTDFTDELLGEIPKMFYKGVAQPIVVEKDRAWGRDELDLIKYVSPEPRIVMLVRPITDIVRSFVHVKRINGDLLPEKDLLQRGIDPLIDAIDNTAYALANVSDKYLFGTYDQLISNPQSFLDQACDFWGIAKREWDFANIVNPRPENDKAFRTEGLHDVRPKLGKRNYEVKVSKNLMNFATELDDALWHDYEQAKEIMPSQFI
jgi:sulfotransferase